MIYSPDQVLAQAAALHPGKSPAWLAKFVKILLMIAQWLPLILPFFMSKKPGDTSHADVVGHILGMVENQVDAENPQAD